MTKDHIVFNEEDYCNCDCHKEDMGIIHFMACCEGFCEDCNKYVNNNLKWHKQQHINFGKK